MTVAKDMIAELSKGKKSRIAALSDPSIISKVTEWIPTGCLPLDLCMGGGVPVGRMVEIYGDTSTGKSLLAAHILAETQEMGGVGVLFDTETATDEGVMTVVGVDPELLVYTVPNTIEELYRDFERIIAVHDDINPGGLICMIWDSVASTSTDKEVADVAKKGMGAATMGIHARLISQMCRIIRTLVSSHRLAFIFVNQTRVNIGVMFGPDKETFGGRAIGYYSSVRLEMKLLGRLKDPVTTDIYGVNVRCGVAKNKVAPPFRLCEFPIIFDQGIDEAEAILWYMKNRKIVTGSSWKKFVLGEEEVKFQDSKWEDLFYQREQEIRQLLMENAGWD